MEEERDEQVGASYTRDKSIRKATRNGYKSRSLNTRIGNLKLKNLRYESLPFAPIYSKTIQGVKRLFL